MSMIVDSVTFRLPELHAGSVKRFVYSNTPLDYVRNSDGSHTVKLRDACQDILGYVKDIENGVALIATGYFQGASGAA
jgi:hypothetical protein